MSDTPEGPGWWLASDGKYYPPEQATPPEQAEPPPTPQAGAVPPQPGAVPPQPGSVPPQPGSVPPQAGAVPPQPGAVPPQPGAVPPQPGAVQPVPPNKNSGCLKVGLIVLAVFVVLGALAVGCLAIAGNEIAEEIDKEFGVADTDDYDLTEGECTVDSFSDALATGTITNTSSERQAFQVTVRFTDADGDLITEDSTFTDGLDPDQTGDWEVITIEEVTTDLTCTIEEVNYSPFD